MSTIEELEAQLDSEKINVSKSNHAIKALETENLELKSIIENLKKINQGLMVEIDNLITKDKYQVKAISDLYAKHRRERDEKGHYIKKSK